jgi:fatty acid desaturase
VFVLDVLGLNIVRNTRMLLRWGVLRSLLGLAPPRSVSVRSEWVPTLAFLVLVSGLTGWLGAWRELLIYWMLPMIGPLMLFVRVRVAAEHLMPGAGAAAGRNNVNHVHGRVWERFLFAPFSINYHIAHHLFPGVPWYNLRRLHAKLAEDPRFAAWARIYGTYWGTRTGIYPTTLLTRS